MALTQFAKDQLRFGIGSMAAGTQIAAAIDAGSGTIYQGSKDALDNAVGNREIGRGLATKFAANTALSANDTWRLAVACGSFTAALAIQTEQAT